MRQTFIDSLLRVYNNTVYLDFEETGGYQVHHFKNDDHLNSEGAKKFTIFLNKQLDSISKVKELYH